MSQAEERASGISKIRIADTSTQDVVVERGGHRRLWWYLGAGLSILILFALLLPSFISWFDTGRSVPRDRIRIASIQQGDFVRDVSVQGRVVAAVSPTLYARSDGTITFLVDAGDEVEAGARLAIVDSPELTNRLKREEALLARRQVDLERQTIQSKQQALQNQKTVDLAQLELKSAEREARRAEDGFEKEAISQIDYEKAKDDLESAEYAHQHAVADARLDNERLAFEQRTRELEVDQQALLVADIQRQVEDLVLVSPVNGVVGNLLVAQKTNVSRNLPVMSVVDLSQFEVEAQIPESYADDLALGMQGEVLFANRTYPAVLEAVSAEVLDNQVMGRLRFQDEVPAGLRQNQRLTTRILLEEKSNTLIVERGQFLETGGGRVAYRVEGDVARRVPIQTGGRSLRSVEIISGLNPGDDIVVSSLEAFEGDEAVLLID